MKSAILQRIASILVADSGRPAIKLATFKRSLPKAYLVKNDGAQRIEGQGMFSQVCRYETLTSENFRKWIDALRLHFGAHRKLWELGYILQALDERGLIGPGKKGLVFAVGEEPIPALLASKGCEIVASDLASHDVRNQVWSDSGQWAAGVEALNKPDICDPKILRERVAFREVDMNKIPDDLTGFDFTWSTCSFEHCGSIELGMAFLENQMRCLKPGGVAVHTTEFNLQSNSKTLTRGNTSIYRLKDIEEIIRRLTNAGHHVEPLDINTGRHILDKHIDRPPYGIESPPRHMRLMVGPFVCTSIGLIIRKSA